MSRISGKKRSKTLGIMNCAAIWTRMTRHVLERRSETCPSDLAYLRALVSTHSSVRIELEDLGTQFSGVNAVCKAIGTGAFHAGDLQAYCLKFRIDVYKII